MKINKSVAIATLATLTLAQGIVSFATPKSSKTGTQEYADKISLVMEQLKLEKQRFEKDIEEVRQARKTAVPTWKLYDSIEEVEYEEKNGQDCRTIWHGKIAIAKHNDDFSKKIKFFSQVISEGQAYISKINRELRHLNKSKRDSSKALQALQSAQTTLALIRSYKDRRYIADTTDMKSITHEACTRPQTTYLTYFRSFFH